jgi:hypothetical protein
MRTINWRIQNINQMQRQFTLDPGFQPLPGDTKFIKYDNIDTSYRDINKVISIPLLVQSSKFTQVFVHTHHSF